MIIRYYCVHNRFIDKIFVYISCFWLAGVLRRNTFHRWSTSTTMRLRRVCLVSFVTFCSRVGFAVRHWSYSSGRYATFLTFIIIAGRTQKTVRRKPFQIFPMKSFRVLEKKILLCLPDPILYVVFVVVFTIFTWPWAIYKLRGLIFVE